MSQHLSTLNTCLGEAPTARILPRSDYTRVGRGHDQELDMDMEYDSPPTSLMEAVSRAGSSISSSTSTSTAVYDDTNDEKLKKRQCFRSLRNFAGLGGAAAAHCIGEVRWLCAQLGVQWRALDFRPATTNEITPLFEGIGSPTSIWN